MIGCVLVCVVCYFPSSHGRYFFILSSPDNRTQITVHSLHCAHDSQAPSRSRAPKKIFVFYPPFPFSPTCIGDHGNGNTLGFLLHLDVNIPTGTVLNAAS